MIRLTPRLIKIKWNVRNERPRSKEERERRRRKYIYIYTYIKDHYTVVYALSLPTDCLYANMRQIGAECFLFIVKM